MAKYRKKPVVIEAIQFTNETWREVYDFLGWVPDIDFAPDTLWIDTLEDGHRASRDDYIIRGVQGEFYPCKPDIFEQTYDKVGE